MKKKIVVRDNRFIEPFNNVQGPILTPVLTDVEKVGRLVIGGYSVYEYVNKGYVKLDMTNYNKDLRTKEETLKENRDVRKEEKPVVVEKPVETFSKKDNKKNSQSKNTNKKIEDHIIEK